MEELNAFLRAIPAAGSSTIALVAYLATVGAWTLITWRVRRHAKLLKHIHHLPEPDRLPAIEAELGVKVPAGLSPEQYLTARKHTFLLIGFLAICVTLVIIVGMALYKSQDQRDRADEYIRKTLGSPSSSYQSAANVLSNGRQMIREAAEELGPEVSNAQLDTIVEKLAQQGLSAAQIKQRLAQTAGTARLQRANEALAQAARTINDEFAELADCYRRIECGQGSEFQRLCRTVRGIQANILAANAAASDIPGLMFNASSAPSILGGGSMDIEFHMIAAENIDYLADKVCKS